MIKTTAIIVSLGMLLPSRTVMVFAEEAKPAAQPAQVPLASVKAVEAGEDQVRIDADSPVKYNAFIVLKPAPRLVVDVIHANIGRPQVKAAAKKGAYLKRVRLGQFSVAGNPVARVVIDLNKVVDYRVTAAGNSLNVVLGVQKAAAVAKAAAPKPAAPSPAVAVKAPAPQAAAPKAAAPAAVSKPAALAAAPKPAPAPASKPAAPPAAPVAVAKAAPASASTAAPSRAPQAAKAPKDEEEDMDEEKASVGPTRPEDAGSMETRNSEELLAFGRGENAAASAPAAEFASYRRPRRDILSSLPRRPVSLDFDGADVTDILKLLAAKANLNIIYGQDVSGTLSLHLTNVPFNEAFSLVLSMRNLVAAQEGENVLRVMTPEVLAKERVSAVGVTRVFPLNYLKAIDAKATIDAVRQAEKRVGLTVPDIKNNAIIVTDSPEGLAAAERLLSQIDVRPQQVLIEAKLIEVNLNTDLELGVQWNFIGQDRAKLGSQTGINTIGTPISPFSSPPTNQPPFDTPGNVNINTTPPTQNQGLARGTGVNLPVVTGAQAAALTLGRITNNYIFNATLQAALGAGKIKVLSDPKIATLNGQQATIKITTQIPYVTSNVIGTNAAQSQVNYTTTGIQLDVTPIINADRRITLKVTPIVSKVSASAPTGQALTSGATSIDTRQADTTVMVRDGETIVIGGLITDSDTLLKTKVPILGDIPLLGWLFKSQSHVRQRVELLIFVTTSIMP